MSFNRKTLLLRLWVVMGNLQKPVTFGIDKSKVTVIMDRTQKTVTRISTKNMNSKI